MFQAVDYVQAQRERTLMIDEIDNLYRRFDILLAPNAGPAPVMARKPSIELWQAGTAPSNLCIPFSMAGGPALALCSGFTDDGLPLGMQIAARPFQESLVLQVGHAYEMVTTWAKSRPRLTAGASVASTPQQDREVLAAPGVPNEDGLTQWLAERAGLSLDESQLALLRAIRPHADAMAIRLRRSRAWPIEGSNVFSLAPGK